MPNRSMQGPLHDGRGKRIGVDSREDGIEPLLEYRAAPEVNVSDDEGLFHFVRVFSAAEESIGNEPYLQTAA